MFSQSKRISERHVLSISHVQHALVHFLMDDLPLRTNSFDIPICILGAGALQRIASLVFLIENITYREEEDEITDIRCLKGVY